MDWKREAENDLKNHQRRVDSLWSTKQKILALEDMLYSVKNASSGADPVQGGASRVEDRLINCIVEIDRLHFSREVTKRLVDRVEKGLASLDKDERIVLERFYINREHGHIDRIMTELVIERSQVYRIHERALRKFTVSLYGMIDC